MLYFYPIIWASLSTDSFTWIVFWMKKGDVFPFWSYFFNASVWLGCTLVIFFPFLMLLFPAPSQKSTIFLQRMFFSYCPIYCFRDWNSLWFQRNELVRTFFFVFLRISSTKCRYLWKSFIRTRSLKHRKQVLRSTEWQSQLFSKQRYKHSQTWSELH